MSNELRVTSNKNDHNRKILVTRRLSLVTHFLLAFQFLTVIPIRISATIDETDIPESSIFFIIVGFVQGILLVATDYFSGMLFHPDLVIGIVLLVLVLSNGGFHLDGLADTFDAVAAKSEGDTEKDRQKRLAIMKDSSIGPIGVTAIVFTLLLKYLSLKNISHFSAFTYYSSIFLMPILPKWTMVMSMFYGKSARTEGLGRLFAGKIRLREVAVSTSILIFLLILPSILLNRSMSNSQYIFYAVLLITMYLLCRTWVNFFNKKFGGLTGDILGAISEITEIFFLLMVIAWSRLSI